MTLFMRAHIYSWARTTLTSALGLPFSSGGKYGRAELGGYGASPEEG